MLFFHTIFIRMSKSFSCCCCFSFTSSESYEAGNTVDISLTPVLLGTRGCCAPTYSDPECRCEFRRQKRALCMHVLLEAAASPSWSLHYALGGVNFEPGVQEHQGPVPTNFLTNACPVLPVNYCV